MKTKLKQAAPTSKNSLAPTNRLMELASPEMIEQWTVSAEREKAARIEKERADAKYEAHLTRWHKRFEKWAKNQPMEDLANDFALALLMLVETRKTSRMRSDLVEILEASLKEARYRFEAMESVAIDSIRKEIFHLEARRKGARKKLSRDPKQKDKLVAKSMYDDWQAGRTIHASGAAFARHVVATSTIEDPNTVQRWMREWRKKA